MTTIQVNASRTYDVVIGEGILHEIGSRVRAIVGGKQACIVTDDTVASLYAEQVKESLQAADYTVRVFVFPHGEASKCSATYVRLLEYLAEHRLTRTDVLVALGGGVVGDLTGFAAATYLRGIPFVQVPTTVLAAVDSSVGGKTAIDLPQGKNLVGAFYQPHLVLCDITTFSTLPDAIFYDGCGEIIKYGMIGNAELLEQLEQPIRENMEPIVATCVKMKRDIVAQDEFDLGVRQLLNLGHTVGHGCEAVSGYSLSHGSAVAAGMAIVTRAAWKKGWCELWCLQKVLMLNQKYHLPTGTIYGAEELYQVMTNDKKRTGDTISLIIPVGRGKSEAKKIPVEELREILRLGLSEVITVERAVRRGMVPKLPSKSVAHRMLIAAALSGVTADCPEFSKDITATKQCLEAMLTGKREFYCGESGSTFRFLLPVAGALGRTGSFVLEGRLKERPLTGLYEQLRLHGMQLSPEGTSPFTVSGKLTAGDYTLPGNVSSQFVSGLLFALPMLDGTSNIFIEGTLESKPYVDLTVAVLQNAGIMIEEILGGYRVNGGQSYHLPATGELAIEGDWSNAAFFLTLGWLTGEKIMCEGLLETSVQGDRFIVSALEQFGTPAVKSAGASSGSESENGCRTMDLRNVPDLAPILALAATQAEGTTVFTGVDRLRLKECDRLLTIQSVLSALGADVRVCEEDGVARMEIRGGTELHGGTVDSFNDHRIAMMAAIAAQVATGAVTITDAGAVRKSYPAFYEILETLRAES